MAVAGSLTYDTKLDTSGLEKGLNRTQTLAVAVGNVMANAFEKVVSTMKNAVSYGIQYNAEIEKYQTALKTLTGSAEMADEIIAQIKEDAAKTPFDVRGLTQANQLLISTGLNADESRDVILALGNAVSATGGGNDELSRMAFNLQQIKNLGKASSVDIRQFGMAGIDIYGLLADYMGVSKQEASEMTVTWETLSGALIQASEEGGKYFGAMEEQSLTLNGQWSNLKDNASSLLGEVMTPLFNFLRDSALPLINDLITGATQTKQWIDEHSTAISIIIGIIASLTAAIIANTIAKNADIIVIWLYVTATETATAVTGAFSAILGFLTSPITLVVLAIRCFNYDNSFISQKLGNSKRNNSKSMGNS